VLGVRLAFGALAERHGRVARLPQQQVVLEERGHGHGHGIQGRHGFHETPHDGLVCRSSCAAVAERVTLPAGLRDARGRVFSGGGGGAASPTTRMKRSLIAHDLLRCTAAGYHYLFVIALRKQR